MQKSLLFIFILILKTSFSYALSPNDITILLPKPATQKELDQFLKADSALKNQEILVPYEYFNLSKQFEAEFENPESYKNTRVIALRFDPCFIEGFGPQSCRKQLRLIWQMINFRSNNTIRYQDSGMHTFFEFNDEEWTALVRDWMPLAKGDFFEPPQVNPVINKQRFEGEYWQKLKSLVLKNCKNSNLVRITFKDGSFDIRNTFSWSFNGFDISKDGKITPIEIPTLNTNQISFRTRASNAIPVLDRVVELDLYLLNAPSEAMRAQRQKDYENLVSVYGPEYLAFMRTESPRAADYLSEKQITNFIQLNSDMQNPKLHNTGTLDCLRCHTTQLVNYQLASQDKQEKNNNINFREHLIYGPAKLSPELADEKIADIKKSFKRYTSPYNLKSPIDSATFSPDGQNIANNFRMIGYSIYGEPFIAQRVMNETAEALYYFSTHP